MLDYQSLAALAAVIREGGFDRAAASLGVTPSAVSQRIRALEERIGAALVVRGQPPEPTEIGARLCAHAERLRLLECELAADLPFLDATPEHVTLRIAVNADSLSTWFPKAIARACRETGTLVDLIIEDEGHTAERLRRGEVQAAVTTAPEPVTGCRTTRLGAMRYVATASPDFIRRNFPNGVTREELSRAPALRFNRNDNLQLEWARLAMQGAAFDLPTHWVPTTQAFLDLSLAGLAWAMNPLILSEPHLAQGRLQELRPGLSLDVPLFWQHTRLGSKTIGALTRSVVSVAKSCLVNCEADGNELAQAQLGQSS